MYGQPNAYGNQPYYQQQQQYYGQPPYLQPVTVEPVYFNPPQQNYMPNYYQPPPQGPTVITIQNNSQSGHPCQFCGMNTENIARRKIGCAVVSWSVCLLLTTGILCCLPFFMDGCKDTEIICVKCQNVKARYEAQCC